MCGIAGFFEPSFHLDQVPGRLIKMLQMQQHRGPDEFGYYFDEKAGIATARLSIIDLSAGQQPLSDASRRYWIAYNGEVYNYLELRKEMEANGIIFKTKSDTEVVLQNFIRHGVQGTNLLNGEFCFAVYDSLRKELFLCRDRFGQRPVFYIKQGNTLFFSSEIKSFLACPEIQLELDFASLSSMFQTWGTLPQQSVFKRVSQVNVGSCLHINERGETEEVYYRLDYRRERFAGSYREACEITRANLEGAVKLRLRSDVEVGTYLSGGLDSTIITAMAQENLNRTLRTYSLSFEDKDYDESEYQLEASESIGTLHHQVHIKSKDIVDFFPEVIWNAELPLFRTAPVPMYLLSKAVNEDNLKVILTGEGSDESFVGYDIFKETLIRSSWHSMDRETQKQAILSLYPYLKHFSSKNINPLISVFERSAVNPNTPFFSHRIRFTNSALSRRLLSEKSTNLLANDFWTANAEMLVSFTPLERAQWLEFMTLLQGYLLSTQGDRVALGNSVENRAPFLDFTVVEWAQSLPLEFKLGPGGIEKRILKDAFAEIIPTSIVKRHKQPYRAPDAVVFLKHMSQTPFMDLLLSESELTKHNWLNPKIAMNFVRKMRSVSVHDISAAEDQAFLLLLSTLLLEDMYTSPEVSTYFSEKQPPITTAIDGRSV
jgi:asparagine synthase (glutamine-hydrolysing)